MTTPGSCGKDFRKARFELAQHMYTTYNQIVFDNRLPVETEIAWNKRLAKKAGQAILTTNPKAGTKIARIELSEKVSKILQEILITVSY